MCWVGNVARIGMRRGTARILVGIFQGRRPIGRRRPGWEDNIRLDLHEVDWEDMDRLIWLRIRAGGGVL